MGGGSLCWQLHFKLVIRFNEEVFLPRPEPLKSFFELRVVMHSKEALSCPR